MYRDSNAWVRRSDLRGITLAMLSSGPIVRMDFHDSPEFHHGRIVQSFPRNWERSHNDHDDRNDHRKEKKDDKKDDRKSDRKKSGDRRD